MLFVIEGKDYKYELEKLSRLFLPFEAFNFSAEKCEINSTENYIYASSTDDNGSFKLYVELKLDGKLESREDACDKADACEQTMAKMLFDCFVIITGYRPPWGILTGIRPAKLMGKYASELGADGAKRHFKNEFLASDEKIDLCSKCFESEERIIERSTPDSFSLYISIPFCPSRCNYCSFVSHSIDKAQNLIPEYVRVLCGEIEETANIAKSLNLKLKTVYIGGGTPTTLSAEQLYTVMKTVNDNFDLSFLEEYTVEAGRPDTVTEEKLRVIKGFGATRISINPQTMNNDILKAIGRHHSAEQTIDAYKLAREIGFDNINMDLIACLSGETLESFKSTVDTVIALNPENVTVHCLTLKRSSNLTKCSAVFDIDEGDKAIKMVSYAKEKLSGAGIKPYYMYRQSKTVGNLENVGYAKKGFEGLYNVYIMDETHTILACGASAVTKLRQPGGDNIERIFNYKYPYEYINRYEELSERKKRIKEFYNEYAVK